MSNEQQFDWMASANMKAKGKRPEFFEKPEDERIYSILMAVVGEVSVLQQRLDTVERLLDSKGAISRSDIENYAPDKDAGIERGEMIREYIFRVMRGPMQAVEAMKETETPIEQVREELLNS